MGCTSGRVNVSYVEAAMMNGDYKLCFDDVDLTVLVQQFKHKSHEGRVSLKDFEELAKTIPFMYADSREVVEFYAHFVHDGHLQLKFLVSLAVLNARGTTSSKVEVLSEAWGGSNGFSREEFLAMLEFLFELSLDHLPKMASKSDSQNSYTKEEFEEFLERARKGKEVSKEAIVKEVFTSESANKAAVLHWAGTGENHTWLKTHSVRANLKKAGKPFMPKKKRHPSEKVTEKVTEKVEVHGGEVKIETTEEYHHHREHHHKEHEDHEEHHEEHHKDELKIGIST